MQNKLERFLSLIHNTSKPDACWIWKAGQACGYGKFWMDGKTISAHRASYLLHHGEIPPHLIVRHTCHRPLCVNPSHLKLGTHADNMQDMVSSSRSLSGEANGASILKEAQAIEIINQAKAGKKIRTIAREMNISRSTVRNVAKGFTWKHLQTAD